MALKHFHLPAWATRSKAVLIGILLLLLCLHFQPDRVPKAPLTRLVRRDASVDVFDLQAGAQANESHAALLKRDYTCSKSSPCSNGACCGASGYCGYGPTYCGTGCLSNCDATAQCGQYAKVAGTKCPLNVCCSQYGFCGTTSDFCGTGCQSNCVLNPTPPAGGAAVGILQNKVIGYYESWSARLSCHKIAPTSLPLDALTHVNFAFAYIDPSSYQIVTMDTATPASLFQDVTNLKSVKQDLKVFVSVGGWTFSDNGTATQPLYGKIAASASLRQTFANNVVHFMKQYGFDGLDIDWEYPGAPDRGGSTQDTANYVSLLQTLRTTFDASGNSYSLSFTAPSSYWYLRWFDLPNMIKYADWINLMTYDLHGVWDASNPIGSIVQGHTNLTEIKLAAALFWRVNIPPAKIVMGFGFYGRSYTLSSPSCNTPGCPFSGASNPGPCSATGGILAYYEIMGILGDSSITPVHDNTAAVNYFTFNKNQWVSYDSAVTFQQKVSWANSVGLGGALIWASDLDDNKYSAHAGLLGRSIKSTPSLIAVDKALSNPQSVIQDIAGSNGQGCFKYTGKCVNLDDNNAMAQACGSGFTVIGWDDAGCGKKSCHCGKPICCPTNTAPKNCIWRGNNNGGGAGSDCDAQCGPGETNIQGIGSSWGGGFLNDGNTNKCARGYKVFCCPNPDFPQVTRGCSYASCRSNCPTGYTGIFQNDDNCFIGGQQYCCPNPVQLTGCHWVRGSGGEDCVNPVCNSTEVEVDRSQFGGSMTGGCSWGRKQAACCTVSLAPPKPASCSKNLCTVFPGFCPNDDDDESADGWTKRSVVRFDPVEFEPLHPLEKRGGRKAYPVDLGQGAIFNIIAIAYPAIGRLFAIRNAQQVIRRFFRLIPGYCTGTSVYEGNIQSGSFPPITGLESEHPIDRQIMVPFAKSSVSGILTSGATPNIPTIPAIFYTNYWNTPNTALGNRPQIGGPSGIQPNTPNNRAMEGFGSTNYPYPFLPTEAQINGAKGRVMGLRVPVAVQRITDLANDAVLSDAQGDADALLQSIRIGFAVFEYLNRPDTVVRWNAVRQQVRLQLGFIEADVGVNHLVDWWDAFTDDYFSEVGRRAQDWAREAINAAAAPFVQAHNNGHTGQLYAQVLGALEEMLNEIAGMQTPPSYTMPNPQPPGSP